MFPPLQDGPIVIYGNLLKFRSTDLFEKQMYWSLRIHREKLAEEIGERWFETFGGDFWPFFELLGFSSTSAPKTVLEYFITDLSHLHDEAVYRALNDAPYFDFL